MNYIVCFKEIVNNEILERLNIKVLDPLKGLKRMVIVEATKEQIEELEQHPSVKFVEQDKEVKIDLEGDVSKRANYGLNYTHSRLRVEDYWERGITGKGVKVCVVDTGCNPHISIEPKGGICLYPEGDTYNIDERGHGTHIAGIIAGRRDKNGSFAGIAPDCDLYIVKASGRDGAYVHESVRVRAINWTVENGMDIVNYSYGTSVHNPAVEEAFNIAYDSGVISITSAGNTGSDDLTAELSENRFPTAYDSVIAVANIRPDNTKATSSTTGRHIEISGYGTQILSAGIRSETDYIKRTGTSMASPVICGIYALYKQLFPNYTAQQLRDKVNSHCKYLGEPMAFGHGVPMPPPELYNLPIIDRPFPQIRISDEEDNFYPIGGTVTPSPSDNIIDRTTIDSDSPPMAFPQGYSFFHETRTAQINNWRDSIRRSGHEVTNWSSSRFIIETIITGVQEGLWTSHRQRVTYFSNTATNPGTFRRVFERVSTRGNPQGWGDFVEIITSIQFRSLEQRVANLENNK